MNINLEMAETSSDQNTGIDCKSLITAIRQGNSEEVETLMSKGIFSGIVHEEKQMTALHLAADHNADTKLFEKILQSKGICITAKDGSGSNVLHIAVRNGNLELVKLLLKQDKAEALLKELDQAKLNPIHRAVLHNRHNVISEMMELKHLIKTIVFVKEEKYGGIPLHDACRLGYLDVVKILLTHKNMQPDLLQQQLREPNYKKHTPLNQAVLKGHIEVARFLLDKCDCPKDIIRSACHNGCTTVHLASIGGSSEMMRLLLDRDRGSINRWSDKLTPLHVACCFGHLNIVEVLIDEYGADAYKRRPDKEDAESGDSQVRKPSQNTWDAKNDETPLMTACKEGHTKVVNFLLSRVEPEPRALLLAIEGGSQEAAASLITHYGNKWKNLLRFTNDEQTTPFRELIIHMPDVAETVLDKCVQIKKDKHVLFEHEFVEDYDDSERRAQQVSVPEPKELEASKSTEWQKPIYDRHSLPLSLMVQFKRVNLLTHPVVASLVHQKWKCFGWLSLLHWLLYLLYISFITALALELPHSRKYISIDSCDNQRMNQTMSEQTHCVGLNAKSIILAVLVIVYSTFRLVFKSVQLCFSIYHASHLLKVVKEFNPIKKVSYFIKKLSLGLSDLMEITLFILTFLYAIFSFIRDGNQCPYSWLWAVGTFVILFSWIELIVLCAQFHFVGVYALMLIRVLKSFLKVLILLCLLVTAFGLALYLTLPNTDSVPGYSLLSVISMSLTMGEDLSGGTDSPGSSRPWLSLLLLIIIATVMAVLLSNLLIGLAVGDIQAIYDEATLQELALQINYILDVEHKLRWIHKTHRVTPTHGKKYSSCEMVLNKIVVLLWGGESFDSDASNEKVMDRHQNFLISHREVYEPNLATSDEVNKVLKAIEQMKVANDGKV